MSTTAIAVPPLAAPSIWQRLREHALPLGAISVIFVMMVPLNWPLTTLNRELRTLNFVLRSLITDP
jgi:hypothetical protein